MKTLKEEREAIVRKFEIPVISFGDNGAELLAKKAIFKSKLNTALLSHEEKVVERVLQAIDTVPNVCTCGGFITAHKKDIVKALTLPITDENV